MKRENNIKLTAQIHQVAPKIRKSSESKYKLHFAQLLSQCAGRHFETKLMFQYIGSGQNNRYHVVLYAAGVYKITS